MEFVWGNAYIFLLQNPVFYNLIFFFILLQFLWPKANKSRFPQASKSYLTPYSGDYSFLSLSWAVKIADNGVLNLESKDISGMIFFQRRLLQMASSNLFFFSLIMATPIGKSCYTASYFILSVGKTHSLFSAKKRFLDCHFWR